MKYSQTCPRCGHVIAGEDLDTVANEAVEHASMGTPSRTNTCYPTLMKRSPRMADRTTVVDRTTVIPSSPNVVFAAVNSPETAPLIDPSVREWRPDTDPIAVGTRFKIRGRLGVLPIRGTSETVRWEPPMIAEYRSVVKWPARMAAQHRFEPRADGGTNYTWSITFREVSIVGRPLVALAARLFARALANQADALTAYLRAAPRPPVS